MSVNFFLAKCQNVTSEKIFGLRDHALRRPAYIDFLGANRKHWIAVIINKQQYDVRFVAVDHCIPFPRLNNKKVKRSDGALFYNSTAVFVELKERSNQRKWLSVGEAQLKNTIRHFEASDASVLYPIKRAYIANRKLPRFNKANTRRSEDFFEETGYVLRVQNSIVLD